ncbi:MAG: phosphoribosylaminoimidazolesuccinocarboxamide synthase [Desulfobacteraceae bacterium]|nr:phosphoribosylaminoimidazolesuccinocarboxamide synthase [Desulfobacteraceae bacterium]MBC2752708.1 phosphoribosylaminoimidazolesuccinocarboxamide synthase [Desulfobacteraceae bacterium]
MAAALYESKLDHLSILKKGKVRDIYDLGDCLLMVATDRLSAYDVIMPDPIPDKGKILTQLSIFWFNLFSDMVPNHLLEGDVSSFPSECQLYQDILADRSMLVKKVEPLPIECVVRGYISGSGWKSYQKNHTICGISLPAGLKESEKLPEPLFTPSTKEEVGQHDINISFEEAVNRVGRDVAEQVRDLSLLIYQRGVDVASKKGIIIADTKFEFGLLNDEIVLIDEVLTPDSSRFWPLASYTPGGPQPSFDKQFVRDYLTSVKFNHQPPGPRLPADVIEKTREKYLEALKLLTGSTHGL